jgi:threonine/homoserine/homoserine lactone efflux protein
MNVLEASAFQALNPKGWIFAFGAVTTFRPAELSAIPGSLAVAGTMMIVILPCAAAWAVAGGAMSRLLSGERAGRAVSLILGGLVAVSVIAVWL